MSYILIAAIAALTVGSAHAQSAAPAQQSLPTAGALEFPSQDFCDGLRTVAGPQYDPNACMQILQNGIDRTAWQPQSTTDNPQRTLRSNYLQFFHLLFTRMTLELAHAGRLGDNRQEFLQINGASYRLADLRRLAPERTAALADAVATGISGLQDIRASAIYIEAFHFNNLPRQAALQALSRIGGPMAISVLSHEGVLSAQDALRQTALQGLARIGGEPAKEALRAALAVREEQAAGALARLDAERTSAEQDWLGRRAPVAERMSQLQQLRGR